jgi:hypothetical protein
VNPTQAVVDVGLPRLSRQQEDFGLGRVLFRDAGFVPALDGNELRLGPEQMAVVGFGRYASPEHDLGFERDVNIPSQIEPLGPPITGIGPEFALRLPCPARGNIRVVVRQRTADGQTPRSARITVEARQQGHALAVRQPDQERPAAPASTGLSWAVAEISCDSPDGVEVKVIIAGEGCRRLEIQAYSVSAD